MRKVQQLSAIQVARMKEPGRYSDGLGLYLQVAPGGSKSWLFRFQRNGQARQMGLGPAHTVSLADARRAAQEARLQLLAGQDPIDARRSVLAAAAIARAEGLTFRQAAEAYIAAHRSSWKNPAHAKQWPSTLSAYVYPSIGALPVSAIDTGHIMHILEAIWSEKPDTAGRVRGRIELVLDWAKARGHRTGENPARWRGHLDKLLPPPTKVRARRHHPALPYKQAPKFMAALRKREGIAARCLEFTILTASRTGEAIGARWDEIDTKAGIWTIPAARMKGARIHRVPLSKRVLAILKALPREGEFVFIGAREGQHLSNMAMLAVLKAMGRSDLTVHGFRSSFRDWAAETTNFPNEVAEMALAHAVSDKVEAAYRRGDMFAKRRSLAEAWATFCMGQK
jgi:integrase